MKRFITLSCSLAFALIAAAVPAKRQSITLYHVDGSTITATLVGDEYFHYYINQSDGTPLFINEEGKCYSPSVFEFNARRQHGVERATAANSSRLHRSAKRRALPNENHTSFELQGTKKALVILVNFSNRAMKYSHDELANQISKKNSKSNGNYGSVHDYFYSQSYGQFDLEFDVVGPVEVSQKYEYYGENNTNGDDKHPAEMVAEACELVDNQVNFADYDWKGDGEAEMVVCIYAGCGEAQGASSKTIWPHQWTLTEAMSDGNDGEGAIILDNTIIDSYLVLNELYGSTGSRLDGIGTFCHEYSHSLGLPDVYDTMGNNFGMDMWNLMDYGSYNNDGYCPCSYTAYEKWFCGWLEPEELSEGKDVENMVALADEPHAYVVYNQANTNEYYLMYNVQQHGWDTYMPGHGMIVMHVDYDEEEWYYNTVNTDSKHLRLSIFHADNSDKTDESNLAGDPYPGTSRNTLLTDTSTPAAKLFNRNKDGRRYMGKPITDITETTGADRNNRTISFTFNGGATTAIDTPLDTPSCSVSEGNWDIFGRYGYGSMLYNVSIEKGKKTLRSTH